MSIPVYATPTIFISDNYFNISMHGGQTITKNITIASCDFGESIILSINTSATAQNTDTEGFTINLSESKIALTDNHPKTIQLILTAVPSLMPDIFDVSITTNIFVEPKKEHIWGGISVAGFRDDKTEKIINNTVYVPFNINHTIIKEVKTEIIKNNTVYKENTTRIEQLEKEMEKNKIIYYYSFIFSLIATVFIIYLYNFSLRDKIYARKKDKIHA